MASGKTGAKKAAGDAGAGSAGESGGGGEDNVWSAFTNQQLEAMETFARNLTQAAAASNHVLAETVKPHDGPLSSADPFHVGDDAAKVWAKFAADPAAAADAQMKLWSGFMDLWAQAARRAAGDEDAAPAILPDKGDKRWRNEEWTNNPVLDIVKQSYLLTSRWMLDTINAVEGVEPAAKRKVAFFAKQMADAFSPSNFALMNPDVMAAAVETRGQNFVEGLKQFAEDLERGGGRLSIRQSDTDKFVVGEDVATAPGQVVFQNELIQLIQYAPATETVYARPLLFFPPWINRFYILDLKPETSMVRWLVDQGFTVFLVSWVNPGPELKDKTFEDYMRQGVLAAVDAVLKQTGGKDVNAVGYCIGGTLLASTLAYLAQEDTAPIASATFFAAQTDFSEAGDLLLLTDEDWLAEIKKRIDENGGVLDGQTMAETFNMLRANDLIWSFVVSNYMLGKAPAPFDLLAWNADQTNLPKAIHLFYLDQFYRKNALSKGALKVGGRTLSLGDINIPVVMQAGREDHIAPFRSVYKGAVKFGGPTQMILAGSGHIAGVMNHPAAKKYQHWLNDMTKLPADPDKWLEGATEHPGSWWPVWRDWLVERSGDQVEARDPKAGPLKPIEPAPGSYVKKRF